MLKQGASIIQPVFCPALCLRSGFRVFRAWSASFAKDTFKGEASVRLSCAKFGSGLNFETPGESF